MLAAVRDPTHQCIAKTWSPDPDDPRLEADAEILVLFMLRNAQDADKATSGMQGTRGVPLRHSFFYKFFLNLVEHCDVNGSFPKTRTASFRFFSFTRCLQRTKNYETPSSMSSAFK